MGALSQLSFPYTDIPASDVKALEKHAEAVLTIQDRQRRLTAENVLKIGKELKAAQERLSNHGNGTFGKWCEQRCVMSARHARRAIATLNLGDEIKDWDKLSASFDVSALYVLSSDTCPEEALADAIKAAKKGEVITHKRAKEFIANYTVEPDDEEDELFGDSALVAFTEFEAKIRDIAKADPASVVNSLSRLREELIEQYGLKD